MRDFTQRDIKQLVDEKVLNGKPFEENGYVFGYHGQMKPYTTYKNYPKNMLDPVFWENAKFSNNYLDPELQKFILSFFDKAEDLVMFHELMDSKFRLIHKAIYEHCIEGVPDYSLTFVDFVADQSVFMEHRAIVPEYKLEDLKKLKKYDFELTEYIFLKQYESCKNAEATKFCIEVLKENDSLPEINKNPLITCEELKHYYTNKFNISVQQLFAQLDYSADATFDLLYRINKYLNEIAPTTETSLTLDKQNNTVQFEVRSPIEEEVIKFPEVLMPIIKFAFSDSYLEKGLMPNYDCEEFTKKLSLHTLHDALEEKLEKNLSKKRLKI